MSTKVRVRYAPSPTGPQHVGGIRTALYNYLFAKKLGGTVILRIEDTDQTRFVPGAEEYIVKSVQWCGFDFDEGVHKGGNYGPYKQSERKPIYKKYVDVLLEKGFAYYAFDSAEQLDEQRKLAESQKSNWKYDAATRLKMNNSLTFSPEETQAFLASGKTYTIRLKVPANENVVVKDMVRGEVVFNSNEVDDKIIFKSDGMPTYHLANVVDDHLMEISHVIRGEEWLPSAPFHVLLYQCFGWENTMPMFAHLPLLLKPNGNGKLSKRDGDALGFPVFPMEWKDAASGEIFRGYKEDGYFPEAFLNILAFLGWNPGTEQEIFSMEELIKSFDLTRVVKSGAKFDPDKAKWFNQQYLMKKSDEELANILQENLDKKGIDFPKNQLTKICHLMKERSVFPIDIYENGKYFFENPSTFDEQTVQKKWKENSAQIVLDIAKLFEQNTSFIASDLEAIFKSYVEDKQIGFGVAMIALRLSLTGQGGGPSLFDIAEVLGKTETLNRLNNNPKLITLINGY